MSVCCVLMSIHMLECVYVCVHLCVCSCSNVSICVRCVHMWVHMHSFLSIWMPEVNIKYLSLLPLCITFGVSLSQSLEGTSSPLTASVSP